jgi:hypothetical protein
MSLMTMISIMLPHQLRLQLSHVNLLVLWPSGVRK